MNLICHSFKNHINNKKRFIANVFTNVTNYLYFSKVVLYLITIRIISFYLISLIFSSFKNYLYNEEAFLRVKIISV